MRHQRVAITGGSGRLGRYVVEEIARHASVTILDTLAPGETAHPFASPHPFVKIDIRDLAGVTKALAGHDAVVHLAAIDDGVPVPDVVYFETNAQGTWNVLHAVHELGITRAVICSSIAALGLGGDRAPDSLPIDEAHPLRPTGTYGLTKQVGETVARSIARLGTVRIACLRPMLVIRDEVVAQIDNLARLEAGDPSADAAFDASGIVEPFTEPLSLMGSYVRPDDVARAFRMALEIEPEPFDVFLVAARDTIGRVNSLERIRARFGALPEVRRPEIWQADPAASAIDCAHAREVLGWEPTGDWPGLVAEKGR